MTSLQIVLALCEMLGVQYCPEVGEELIATVEQLQSLVATGELPERWTCSDPSITRKD